MMSVQTSAKKASRNVGQRRATTKRSNSRSKSSALGGSTKKPMSAYAKRHPMRPRGSVLIPQTDASASRSPGKDLDMTEELENFSKLEGDYMNYKAPKIA